MAEIQNLEAYRKQKKQQHRRKRWIYAVCVLAAACILAGVVAILPAGTISRLFDGGDERFPLTLTGEQPTDICTMQNGFVVLSKSSLTLYHMDGTVRKEQFHGYTNPVLCKQNDMLLLYDRGGTAFFTMDGSGNISEQKTDFSILCGQIAKDGSIAIATTHDQYASYVQVYDKKLALKYWFGAAADTFSSLAFSADSRYLSACAIDTSEGLFCAEIYRLDTQTEAQASIQTVYDMLPLSISYLDAQTIAVVGKDSVAVLQDGKQEVRYTYEGELVQMSCDLPNVVTVVTEIQQNGISQITSIGKNGTVTASAQVEEVPTDLDVSNDQLVFLGSEGFYVFDRTLKQTKQIDLPHSVQKIACNQTAVILLSGEVIQKYYIS